MSDPRVLAVDDEPDMLEIVAEVLTRPGLSVVAERDAGRAVARLREESFDVLVSDLRMPGMDGLSLLRAAKEADPGLCVVVLTAYPTIETAIEAIRNGAFDYVVKPFEPDHLRHVVGRALDQRRLEWENRFLRRLAGRAVYERIVGGSPAMRAVFDLVERAAPTESSVLIVGESGTGKELVARAIHARSPRARREFVPLDCGALPENLLESELFGHERGAYTGAVTASRGLLEFAGGGTFFLDEVCELPLPLQAKLLRTLQERQYRRVGGRETREADVRIVAATNRPIEREVAEHRFREDLYYRLNVVQIEVPPLRDRTEDVPALVAHFLEQFSRASGPAPRGIAPETMDALVRYRWPGNVRELRNVVERAVSLSRNEFLLPEDLPEPVRDPDSGRAPAPVGTFGRARAEQLDTFERRYLTTILVRTRGNVSQAARIAGLARGSFYRLLHRHGLHPEEFAGRGEGPQHGSADPGRR